MYRRWTSLNHGAGERFSILRATRPATSAVGYSPFRKVAEVSPSRLSQASQTTSSIRYSCSSDDSLLLRIFRIAYGLLCQNEKFNKSMKLNDLDIFPWKIS